MVDYEVESSPQLYARIGGALYLIIISPGYLRRGIRPCQRHRIANRRGALEPRQWHLKPHVHNLLPDDLICYRLLPRFESNWAARLLRYSAGQARSDFTSRQACDRWTMGAAGEGK